MNDTDIIDYKCTECDADCHVQHIRYIRKKQFLCKSCSLKGVNKKHGMADHRLYYILRGMKARCYNKNRKDYCRYGALGVTICQEWIDNREAFFEWALKNGYSDDLVIDKDYLSEKLGINPAIYSPETCRWITPAENSQTIKKTNRNRSGYIGVSEYKNRDGSCKYKSDICTNGEKFFLGYFKTAMEAAIARDTYIVKNSLKHTLNGVL